MTNVPEKWSTMKFQSLTCLAEMNRDGDVAYRPVFLNEKRMTFAV